MMKLDTLPQDIMNHVMENLKDHDFWSLSATCSRLRSMVFKYIFQFNPPLVEAIEGYYAPQFGDLVRPFYPTFPCVFKWIFYDGPLWHEFSASVAVKVGTLIFEAEWFQKADPDDIAHWLGDIHPESIFRIVSVKVDGVDNEKVIAFFQNLDKINGLVCLAVHGKCQASILDAIKSPTLRQLDLHLPSFIPVIGRNPTRPKLNFVHCLHTKRPANMFPDEEAVQYSSSKRWDRLQKLKDDGINFTYWQGTPHYMEPILIPFVFFHAERNKLDPIPMVRWLLESLLAPPIYSDLDLGLERFIPLHRDTCIELLTSIIPKIYPTKLVPPSITLRIHLRRWNQLPTLPDELTDLYISTPDQIDPNIITQAIERLKQLKSLYLVLYMERTGNGTFLPTASCTHAKPDRLPTIKLPTRTPHPERWVLFWTLSVRKNGEYWYEGRKYSEDSNKPDYFRKDNILPEVTAEVRAWFNMNPTFWGIDMYFVVGSGIESCFDREMYEEDCLGFGSQVGES